MASQAPSSLSTTSSHSPASLRAPSSRSPIVSRRDNSAEPSRGWTASNVPRRTPNTYASSESEGGSGRDSPEVPRIGTALGAEGGFAAINARRRQSTSFKTLSTGSLVSNSPFRTGGAAAGPPLPLPTSAAAVNSIYGASRLPQATTRNGGPSGSPMVERRVSGSRKGSGEVEVVKENMRDDGAARDDSPRTTTDSTYAKPPSSPSIPFRPVRSHAPSPSVPNASSFTSTAPRNTSFRPTRPQSALQGSANMDDFPRRQSSSYAAVRKNGLVSSSPFISRGVPTASPPLEHPSPPLHSTPSPSLPFETPAVDHQPAQQQQPLSQDDHKLNGPMGLGIRPGGAPVPERHFGGVSAPPSSTPPHERQRSNSYSSSPSSALSPLRRGMTGPRPLENEEIESEDLGRTLRRQPSCKTVTWAATEEVLEFEVEEEERRRSGASERSESSSVGDSDEDGEEWRNRDEDVDEEAERSLGYEDEANERVGYEEGGSVELHNFADESEDDHEGSAVSVASSTVEDMMGEIDAFMGDVFSPSLITDDDDVFGRTNGDLDLASLSKSLPKLPLASTAPEQAHPGPQSAFSVSSTGAQSDSDSDNDDLGSDSSYTDEEEVVLQAARARRISEAMMEAERDAPVWTSAPVSRLAPSSSAYSLPDLPENSPFLGFEDTGTSSSVVTFDLGDEPPSSTSALVEPLFAAHAPIPFQSTPTKNVPLPISHALDSSPSLSAFADASPPPLHLSRHASIVESELSSAPASANKFASMRGSLRGASKLREGAPRLDEKLRQYQATLATPSQASEATDDFVPRDLDLFPHPPPLKPSLPLHAEKPARAIQARPALKVTEATVSTTMLPTIAGSPGGTRVEVGALLTAQVVDEMESPLDRLRKEVGGEEWKEGESMESSKEEILPVSESGLSRRRSLSTGDLAARAKRNTRPAALPHHVSVPEDAFGRVGLDEGLHNVFGNRKPVYRVRETAKIVYANDGRVATVGTAGDVDPGRAWRKKRPSDMNNMVASLADFKRMSEPERLDGQVFVTLVSVRFANLPIPSRGTSLVCWLGSGKNQVKVGEFALSPVVRLRKEFELVCTSVLKFNVELRIPISPTINSHLLPLPAPASVSSVPSSPTKSPHRLRNVFSSPKKKAPVPIAQPPPPPPPERITQYLDLDGSLANVQVVFAAEAAKCRTKTVRLELPLERNGGGRMAAQGTVTIELFHLPSIPGIKRDALPKSMDEIRKGLESADFFGKIQHQGVLTQMGGDCGTWKRRLFKIRGSFLIPYSEVTKKAYVEIDLANVVTVEDVNAPTVSSSSSTITRSSSMDMDDDPWRMERSFKLTFQDDSEIRCFADTDADKATWLAVLRTHLDAPPTRREAPPGWAVMLRKLQTA